MHSKQLKKGGYLVAATLILSGMSLAKTTSKSYDMSLSQEATSLLNELKVDAQKVQTHADKLNKLAETKSTDWKANSNQWVQIKQQADEMMQKVNRLEAISSSVTPSQRKAILRATPEVRLIALQVQDATTYLNAHHDNFVSHKYDKYPKDVLKESRKISHFVNSVEEHAQRQNEKNNKG